LSKLADKFVSKLSNFKRFNMQNLKETQDIVYQEVKSLLQEFSGYASEKDFIENYEKVKIFSEKVTALKIYNEVENWLPQEEILEESTEREAINFEIDTKQISDIQDDVIIEEHVADVEFPEEITISETVDEQYFIEKEQEQIVQDEMIKQEAHQELEEKSVLQNEIENKEEEERLHQERVKIIEIEKHTVEEKTIQVSEIHESHHSKKFKLSHIKGLNIVQSLFDDDPLEHIQEEPKEEIQHNTPSLLKNNMPTDYLEAEKQLPDFKLDINDKIAFTKLLFDGSQVELNAVISKLNSFKTLEGAKDYLSDVYYDRNWGKVDEYAQRLWSLVENKFM
jgi:hypothetical protein